MAGTAGSWVISPQDRAQHERTFYSLGPINGKLSGEKARNYLVQSGLPTNELGHIWTLCDVDRDGQLTSAEFSMAVYVIFCRKSGVPMPRTLPPSLVQSASVSASPAQPGILGQVQTPASQQGFSGQVMRSVASPLVAKSSLPGSGLVPLPGGQQQTPGWQQGVAVQSIGNSLVPGQMSHTASLPSHFGKGNPPDGTNSTPSNSLSVGGDWAIPSSSRFQYNRMFSNADRFHRGYLTGMEVRPLLLRTGVAQGPLAQIWALVVTDGNSAMKCEDFVIAMHLADCVSKGRQLPATLPPELGKLRKSSTPGISRAGRGGVSVTKSSFAEKSTLEDRKRDNFTKGQEVLERKRQELQEQRRKEEEEKMRKLQEEEEKRAKERLEQELKQQAEMERQRRKMIEEQQRRDMEEQKVLMQRKAAQQEMERKRQEDHVRQRKMELMQQRSRLVDQVNSVKPQARRIAMELDTLEHQRAELKASKDNATRRCEELKSFMQDMTSRGSTSSQRLAQIRAETMQSRQQLSQVTSEREKLSAQVAELRGGESVQAYQSAMNDMREITSRVSTLRQEQSNTNQQILQKKTEAEAERHNIMNLHQEEKEMTRLAQETRALQVQQERQMAEEKHRQEVARQRRQEQEAKLREEQRRQREEMERRQQEEEKMRKAEEERRKEQQKLEDEKKRKAEEVEAERKRLEEEKKSNTPASGADLFGSADGFGSSWPSTSTGGGDAFSTSAWPSTSRSASETTTNDAFSAGFSTAFSTNEVTSSWAATPSAESKPTVEPHYAVPPKPEDSSSPFGDSNDPFADMKAGGSPADLGSSASGDVFAIDWAKSTGTTGATQKVGTEDHYSTVTTKSTVSSGVDVPDGFGKWRPGAKKSYDVYEIVQPAPATTVTTSRKESLSVGDKTAGKASPAVAKKPSPIIPKRPAPVAAARLSPMAARPTAEDANKPIPQPRRATPETAKVQAVSPPSTTPQSESKDKEDAVRRKVEELQRKKAELQNLKRMRELEAKKSELESKKTALEQQQQTQDATQADGVFTPRTRYKAEFAFQGRSGEELTFQEGDIITSTDMLGEAEAGWLGGEFNGKKGWFPQNYVTVLPVSHTEVTAMAVSSAAVQTRLQSADSTTSFQPTSFSRDRSSLVDRDTHFVPTAVPQTSPPKEGNEETAVALYAWKAKKDTHLSFKKGDVIAITEKEEMWWSGELDGRTGWFPKSYVKMSNSSVSTSTLPREESAVSLGPPVTPPMSPPGGEEHIALYPYTGPAGDLSFSEGDVIRVTKKDGEWWEGSINGRSGMFPATYVSPKNDAAVTSPPAQETPKASAGKPVIATVVAPFNATSPEELSLAVGQLVLVAKQDGDWWEGTLQARGKKRATGRFPRGNVKCLSSPAESPAAKQGTPVGPTGHSPSPAQRSPSAPARMVQALFDYVATNEDELTFSKGDMISVHERGGSWWRGQLNGKVGLFPSNYIQEMDQAPVANAPSPVAGTVPQSQSLIDMLSPGVYASLSPMEKSRQQAIYEMIVTEQSYVEDLIMVTKVFQEPLLKRGVFTEEDNNMVFTNILEIINSNSIFSRSLKTRQTCDTSYYVPVIGDLLCEQLPRLTSHVRFCSCQMRATNHLLELSTTDAFQQFEEQCVRDRVSNGLPLQSFLLKPMQRVTKYPLLVKQILKYTPEDHTDYSNMLAAHELACNLAAQVNEGVRMQENSDRLEWMQTHISMPDLKEDFHFNSNTNCLGPRKILREGTISKVVSGRELHAVLFNDFLLLAKPANTNPFAKAFGAEKEENFSLYRQPYFLNEVLVKEASLEEFGDNCCFHISHLGKIVSLRAESKSDRDGWVKDILKANSAFVKELQQMKEKTVKARKLSVTGHVATILVHLLDGKNLKASDPTGKSDPYVRVLVGQQEFRSQVILETLNPTWDHKMLFNLHDLSSEVLNFTVFDHDRFSPDDFLGRAEVSVGSLTGPGPWRKVLVLHGVDTGEIRVHLELNLHKPKSVS